MALDPNLAALISVPYRYAIAQDATIKAEFGAANVTEIDLDTNLDATSGAALANSLFAMTSTYARTFQVVIEDVLFLEDFTVSPNRYTLSFPRHPSAGTGIYTVTSAKVDYLANRTTLTVRG